MPKSAIIAAIAAALCIAGPAVAQDLSADQIIQKLKLALPSADRRGIRPVGPSTETPPAQVPPPSVDLTVQFATGSAWLTPAATHTLDTLRRALSSSTLSNSRCRIEGHTDTVGTRQKNQVLSEQRASTVVDYLSDKWGVERHGIQAVGMGQDHQRVPTGPGVPEPATRRVTVINLGA